MRDPAAESRLAHPEDEVAHEPLVREHALPEHPRDRLLRHGPDTLSERDLLAVLLTTSARDLQDGGHLAERHAASLLGRFGSLRGVGAARVSELTCTRGGAAGIGRVSALRVVAALALGRRARDERLEPGARLRSSADIFEYFHGRLRDLKKERFLSVLVDGKNRVIREARVSEGILTASLVHPREVFVTAIRESAAGIVLVHNHPSGDPEPSPEDHEVTRRLCAVGELIGIKVLDHVVVGDGHYVSFLERGLISP